MIWFVAAAVLLIADMFLGTLYLLILSAALFAAGLTAQLFDNGTLPFAAAAVCAAVGLIWVHRLIRRRKALSAGQPFSDGNDLDSGHTVAVVRRLHNDMYEVRYRGTLWQARAENPRRADNAVITGKESNILFIRFPD